MMQSGISDAEIVAACAAMANPMELTQDHMLHAGSAVGRLASLRLHDELGELKAAAFEPVAQAHSACVADVPIDDDAFEDVLEWPVDNLFEGGRPPSRSAAGGAVNMPELVTMSSESGDDRVGFMHACASLNVLSDSAEVYYDAADTWACSDKT